MLEYLHSLQLSLRVARFVLERVAQEEAGSDETLSEKAYVSLITETIRASSRELDLQEGDDFQQYYELICTRMLLLPHSTRSRGLSTHEIVTCERFIEFFRLMDSTMRQQFDQPSNAFHPQQVRLVHRQYLQLDRDGNGLLSIGELQAYGKKRAFNPTGQEPTHDLTVAFVTQLFAEVPTFDGEMDYHAYLDVTLLLRDTTSTASLRFFFGVLDFHKQGFLDAFTLDFFLRSLLEKIREHGGTKLGGRFARFMTDYVAYRAYEDSGGRFSTS
ncbi:hypothetical protein BBJ28_00002179 [Nothophytophthora sp. Chile5]|nr:hypothetical protein BBJ28_00002179 [Nothophytophthora sp. Chile5]